MQKGTPSQRLPIARTLPEVLTLIFALLLAVGAHGARVPERAAPCALAWQPDGLVCRDDLSTAALDAAPSEVATALGAPLDVNRATRADLEAIRGIGVRRAQAIVALRESRGGYCAVDELLDVRGIGAATLARLAPHLRVGKPPPHCGVAAPPRR